MVIAELRELVAHGAHHLPAVREAMPALLEIADAARVVLRLFDDPNTDPWWGVAGADARWRLRTALAEVR